MSSSHDIQIQREIDIAAMRISIDEIIFGLFRLRQAGAKLGFDMRLLGPVVITLETLSRRVLDNNGSRPANHEQGSD